MNKPRVELKGQQIKELYWMIENCLEQNDSQLNKDAIIHNLIANTGLQRNTIQRHIDQLISMNVLRIYLGQIRLNDSVFREATIVYILSQMERMNELVRDDLMERTIDFRERMGIR